MHISRDASWDRMLQDAMEHYGTKDVTERCVKLANATWRCVTKARELRAAKMARSTRVLETSSKPSQKRKGPSTMGFCQGKTKSGERCRFKASCNGYCKKHSIV
jgi:hypothetical protein